MECILPRIPDTLGSNEVYAWSASAIDKWILGYLGVRSKWEWVDKLNCKFKILGSQIVYQLCRYGKWFEVYKV